MRKLFGFGMLLALGASAVAAAGGKKNDEPFYRRYLVVGNPLDERILEQEKRVVADPNSADLRNDFGNLLAARRFPKEARDQYRAAMKLDKRNYLAPYNLGMLYETEGETSRAISAYEASVDRNRGFPPSRFRLGRLYEKRGWNGKAIEQYARALRIDRTMRDPRRNPLIVDTRLLDQVSLENYPKDLAAASMASEAAYAEEPSARRVPVDRPVSSDEVEPASDAPISVQTPVPAPVRVLVAPTPAAPPTAAPAPINVPPLPTPVVVRPAGAATVAPPPAAPPVGGRPTVAPRVVATPTPR